MVERGEESGFVAKVVSPEVPEEEDPLLGFGGSRTIFEGRRGHKSLPRASYARTVLFYSSLL